MKQRPTRHLIALLCVPVLLSACSASARPPMQAHQLWPEPQPTVWQEPFPAPRTTPNFQAPSAPHCARPIQTREVPGRSRQDPWGRSESTSDSAAVERLRKAETWGTADAASGAPAPARPSLREPLAPPAEEAASRWAPGAQSVQPGAQLHQQQQQPATGAVTAGMVDDNADFSAYLAFRDRTRVAHRPRDIRERHSLKVSNSRGLPAADAEVAVLAASGRAMWARTDAGGRVWLHPDAFDDSRAASYQVVVRQHGQQASARLDRGQKSAVQVVLDAPPAPARARLDLVFLIDATGSMADEINKLKATLRTIADEVARLPSRPDICFGLVAYRDRNDAFLLRSHDLTNDLGAFQGVLNGLQAAGGGDYPEAMNEALHETVHGLSWRGDGATRLVVLLADAPPHLDRGGPYYDDDMLAALGKGIKIFSIGASGLDRQGEYVQRQLAQYTGGRFVFLTYAQAHRPASGPGRETVHDVRNYSVDTLDRLVVRLVSEELGQLSQRN